MAERPTSHRFLLWRDAQMPQSLARHNREPRSGYGLGRESHGAYEDSRDGKVKPNQDPFEELLDRKGGFGGRR